MSKPFQQIESKARLMHADDEDSVHAVADEVFNFPHVFGRMPAPVETAVKERLVRNEIAFLRGQRSGVREEDVVLLFDTMADRLHLPSYMKTSKKQVRALRMALSLGSPSFMGRGLDREMKVGDSIDSEMSVLQAVHLSAVLLDQKFLDPNYQLPPEQWDREAHDREVEFIKERQQIMRSSHGLQHAITTRSNPKRIELHQAFSKSTTSLGASDLQSLLETGFRILKLD